MKKMLFLLAMTCMLTFSCDGRRAEVDPLAHSGRTVRTERLLSSLRRIMGQRQFMFGHHDDAVYGVGWVGDSARSDVESVCGARPAVLGFDLGRIEMGSETNLDGVSFERMRREIIDHYERGGLATLSWHCYNPANGRHAWVTDSLLDVEQQTVAEILADGTTHERFLTWLDRVAAFINSLETPRGVKVPVVFRPWHEHTGSWFWWGAGNCSVNEFKALWRLTVEGLRGRGVVNALYAYSTGLEAGGDPERFMERYPGDDLIDLLGLDFYCSTSETEEEACVHYIEKAAVNVPMLCRLAEEHGKAAAITETGYEGIPATHWWTQTLMPAIATFPVCYVLVWRNAHDKPGHYFAPYPGQASAADFATFRDDARTLFLGDDLELYD